jgi:hypothetical protein
VLTVERILEIVSFSAHREGYGIFIVFIYAIVLPLPTIICFYKDTRSQDLELAGVDSDIFDEETSNPLAKDDDDESEQDATESLARSTSAIAPPSGATLSRLAKIQREKQDLQNEVKEVYAELHVLQKQVASNGASDGLAPRADVKVDPESPTATTEPQPASGPAEIMKQIMADESLSEEVRQSAKQSLDEVVSRQLAESKALTQIENAERMVDTEQRQRKITLAKLASEQRFNSEYLVTMKKAQETFKDSLAGPTAAAARDALVIWLMENRLMHHEKTILDVTGQHAAVEDLEMLTEQDVAEISAKMTRVEALRFNSAMQALSQSVHEGSISE